MIKYRVPLFSCIAIETINKCNRKCNFCKFGQLKHTEKYELMEWSLIEKIVTDLVELDFKGRVSWFKINEPMLDKRIFDIVEFTKNRLSSCFCSLISNGDLVDNDVIKRFKSCGLDRLGISVYDDLMMAKVSTWPKEPFLRVSDKRNCEEKQFVENRGGNINLSFGKPNIEVGCQRPFTMLNVNTDGSVVLCCADFYKQVVTGNVNNNSLKEVWYSEVFDKYRQHLLKQGRRELPLCELCSHNGKGHKVKHP